MSAVVPTRDQAFALLSEYTKSESLIKHGMAVEAALKWYAQYYNQDVNLWQVTGLLHDFDYERFPTYSLEPVPTGHPFSGCEILKELSYSDEIIQAILGHAKYSGVERKSLLAKALFACDELSGLITAAVLVRPDKSIHNLEVNSVKKKMKDKTFARGVDREDIKVGCEELGIELDQHIQNVILGMKDAAESLGLQGVA